MIFLYVLLALLLLLCLVLFCDIALKIEYRDSLKLTLYFLGIPFDLQKLIQTFSQNRQEQKKEPPKPKETKKRPLLQTLEDLYSFLCAILRAVRAVTESFQKHLKIRLSSLTLTAASKDAAKTAMQYGTLSAVISSLLAFCEENTRFSANYKKLCIKPDFEGEKLHFSIRLTLFIKPVFLLTTYTRAHLAYFEEILSMPDAPKTPHVQKKGTDHE